MSGNIGPGDVVRLELIDEDNLNRQVRYVRDLTSHDLELLTEERNERFLSAELIGPGNHDQTTTGNTPLVVQGLITLLVSPKRADATLGDLEEYFRRDCLTKGLRRARVLHWCRVLHSVGPLLWPALKRLFVAFVGLDAFRRWIGR